MTLPCGRGVVHASLSCSSDAGMGRGARTRTSMKAGTSSPKPRTDGP